MNPRYLFTCVRERFYELFLIGSLFFLRSALAGDRVTAHPADTGVALVTFWSTKLPYTAQTIRKHVDLHLKHFYIRWVICL